MMFRHCFDMGRDCASNWWLGKSIHGDRLLLTSLPLHWKASFLLGLVSGLSRIYGEQLFLLLVCAGGALLIVAIVYGWGVF